MIAAIRIFFPAGYYKNYLLLSVSDIRIPAGTVKDIFGVESGMKWCPFYKRERPAR
jgi:hypothetical protein